MNKVSVIIPTLNEENNIVAAIKSVQGFADEIIVIDSFSTDKTLELANKFNARVLQRKFDDFSTQKNYAISLAQHSWVYILDADERVTPEVSAEIKQALSNPKNYVGFYVGRIFYYKSKKINYGGWGSDKVIRLFSKKHCEYDGKPVHEKVKANGNVGYFKNKINHFSFIEMNLFKEKLNKYGKLQAQELFLRNRKTTFYHSKLKPLVRFFIHYVIRFGFLDGYEGFQLSYLMGYGVKKRYEYLNRFYESRRK